MTVATTAPVTARTASFAAAFRDRLVLPVTEPSLDVVAGVPPSLRGPRRHPGRAVHLGPGGALLCQLAEPPLPVQPPVPAQSPVPTTRQRATLGSHLCRPRSCCR
ncbi:hypothetical protein [Cellulomonas soli]